MTGDRGYEAYRGDLNRRCVTLAESLGARRLPELHVRQMARHAAHGAQGRSVQLATAARV